MKVLRVWLFFSIHVRTQFFSIHAVDINIENRIFTVGRWVLVLAGFSYPGFRKILSLRTQLAM